MNETFMKEKPVLPLLLSMALPNVISMLVNSLYNIVDSLFVARISEDAMTALSLVFPIQNFSNAIAIGFGIGINAMIALYLGAGDREKAEIAATHGFVLSLVHGVVMMAVSIAIMPGFLRRFTQDEALIAAGITYSTIVFLFLVVNMVSLAFEKIFQAVGRMKVSMVVCNILLDLLKRPHGGRLRADHRLRVCWTRCSSFGLGPVPPWALRARHWLPVSVRCSAWWSILWSICAPSCRCGCAAAACAQTRRWTADCTPSAFRRS